MITFFMRKTTILFMLFFLSGTCYSNEGGANQKVISNFLLEVNKVDEQKLLNVYSNEPNALNNYLEVIDRLRDQFSKDILEKEAISIFEFGEQDSFKNIYRAKVETAKALSKAKKEVFDSSGLLVDEKKILFLKKLIDSVSLQAQGNIITPKTYNFIKEKIDYDIKKHTFIHEKNHLLNINNAEEVHKKKKLIRYNPSSWKIEVVDVADLNDKGSNVSTTSPETKPQEKEDTIKDEQKGIKNDSFKAPQQPEDKSEDGDKSTDNDDNDYFK